MFEFALWILFGAITGWIGSLITRTDDRTHTIVPFVIIGVGGAALGGYVTRNFGGANVAGTLSWNPNSLIMAWFSATICVVALSFFGKTSSS